MDIYSKMKYVIFMVPIANFSIEHLYTGAYW